MSCRQNINDWLTDYHLDCIPNLRFRPFFCVCLGVVSKITSETPWNKSLPQPLHWWSGRKRVNCAASTWRGSRLHAGQLRHWTSASLSSKSTAQHDPLNPCRLTPSNSYLSWNDSIHCCTTSKAEHYNIVSSLTLSHSYLVGIILYSYIISYKFYV